MSKKKKASGDEEEEEEEEKSLEPEPEKSKACEITNMAMKVDEIQDRYLNEKEKMDKLLNLKTTQQGKLTKLIKKSSKDRQYWRNRDMQILENKKALDFNLNQYQKMVDDYLAFSDGKEKERNKIQMKYQEYMKKTHAEVEKINQLVRKHNLHFQQVVSEYTELREFYPRQAREEEIGESVIEVEQADIISRTFEEIMTNMTQNDDFQDAEEDTHKQESTQVKQSTVHKGGKSHHYKKVGKTKNKAKTTFLFTELSSDESDKDSYGSDSSGSSSPPSSNPSSSDDTSPSSSSDESRRSRRRRQQRKRRYRHDTRNLPDLEIIPFDGQSRQSFITWWTAFRNIIHNNKRLRKDEKMAYLKSYMQGEALAVVSGFPTKGHYYRSALKEISMRYGRTNLIIEDIVLKFDDLKIANTFQEFRKIFNDIYATIMQLKHMGRNVNRLSDVMIPVLKSKIPPYMKRLWNKECYKYEKRQKKITITKFLDFLHEEIIVTDDPHLERVQKKESIQKKESNTHSEKHKGLPVSMNQKETISEKEDSGEDDVQNSST